MAQTHALIIDDNAKNRQVLVRLLQNEGVTSTEVTDPQTLNAVLQGIANLDVVFLDLEMPRLDGFAVFEIIRADRRFAKVPIIAYTVHISEIAQAHTYGFDGFLGKPLDSERFPDQLARILRGEQVWETA
jgi:two-component system cell cycle response regulator DivK